MKKIFSIVTVLAISISVNAQHKLSATKYYPGHNCGMVTADGSKINIRKIHTFEHRWVALSRDMFNKGYKLGDRIHVTSSNPLLNGVWTVKDKMGPRVRNGIDFLMTRENSKGFGGRCTVTIKKIGLEKKTVKPRKENKNWFSCARKINTLKIKRK